MQFLESLRLIFSNRELVLIFWLLVVILVMFLVKSIRQASIRVLKALVPLTFYIGLLLVYCEIMIFPFALSGLWDTSLLKDTVFWFLGFAMVLFFNINKAQNADYFKKVAKDTLKWTIAIEFIINFYTFSLPTELIILPIMVFLGLLQAAADLNKEHAVVSKFVQNLLSIIGLGLIIYIAYRTFTDPATLFTTSTLKSLLLPIVFSILALPFFYVLALYINYETFFVRIRFMLNDKKKQKHLRSTILRVAQVKLNHLTAIQKNISAQPIHENDDYLSLVRSLVKKKKIKN